MQRRGLRREAKRHAAFSHARCAHGQSKARARTKAVLKPCTLHASCQGATRAFWQSQRDWIIQPSNGVARNELPWDCESQCPATLKGLKRIAAQNLRRQKQIRVRCRLKPPHSKRWRVGQTLSNLAERLECARVYRRFPPAPHALGYRSLRRPTEHAARGVFVAEGDKVVRRLRDCGGHGCQRVARGLQCLPAFCPRLQARTSIVNVFTKTRLQCLSAFCPPVTKMKSNKSKKR